MDVFWTFPTLSIRFRIKNKRCKVKNEEKKENLLALSVI